jgi:hypothetical protein
MAAAKYIAERRLSFGGSRFKNLELNFYPGEIDYLHASLYQKAVDLTPSLFRWGGLSYIPSWGFSLGPGLRPLPPTPLGTWGYGFGEHYRLRFTGPEHPLRAIKLGKPIKFSPQSPP